MSKHILKAKQKEASDKNKQLRANNQLLGNVYGKKKNSLLVKFSQKDFAKIYSLVGDTGLVYLDVEDLKKQTPAMIKEIQLDPISGKVLHVSFYEVNLKEKVEAEVPIELIGENKVANAVVVQTKDSVLLEALPANLPKNIEIDISSLVEIGQSVLLSDLKIDREKINLILGEEDESAPVVILQEVKEEVVEEEVVEEIVEEGVVANESDKITQDGGEN